MIEILAASVFVLFVWWFSTGAVLHVSRVVRKPDRGWSLAVSGIILVGSWAGLALTSSVLSIPSVVGSFCCVIGVWAWHEYMFLTGVITGNRRETCPEDAEGLQRFRYAFAVLRHHEIALLVSLIVVTLLTWGGDNPYGLVAFLILWVMRLSAKFNLFFGVPHFGHEMLPDKLAYLCSYFRKRRVTAFYWLSLLLSSVAVAGCVAMLVLTDGLTRPDVVGLVIVTSLLMLAIIEHAFMALPFKDTQLWRWAMATHAVEHAGEHASERAGTAGFTKQGFDRQAVAGRKKTATWWK